MREESHVTRDSTQMVSKMAQKAACWRTVGLKSRSLTEKERQERQEGAVNDKWYRWALNRDTEVLGKILTTVVSITNQAYEE